MKHTGSDIIRVLCSYLTIDDQTGSVKEVFGWGDGYVEDNLRKALAYGVSISRRNYEVQLELANTSLTNAQNGLFIFSSRPEKIRQAKIAVDEASNVIGRIDAILSRIKNADDLSADERNERYPHYSTVSDKLIEECREWIGITLIDREGMYEVDGGLIPWNCKKPFYRIENGKNFGLSEMSVSAHSYRNNDDGSVHISYLAWDRNEKMHGETVHMKDGCLVGLTSDRIYYDNATQAIKEMEKVGEQMIENINMQVHEVLQNYATAQA